VGVGVGVCVRACVALVERQSGKRAGDAAQSV